METLEDSVMCNSGADTEENEDRTASFSKLCGPIPPAIPLCTEEALEMEMIKDVKNIEHELLEIVSHD